MGSKIIYKLTIEDIQNVAQQELERNLTIVEVNKVVDLIGESFDWYNPIADAIINTITINNTN